MPTETEIVDQLRDYGSWLAAQPGVDVATPARRVVVETALDDIDEVDGGVGGRDDGRSGWTVLLAAAAVLAAIAAVLVLDRRASAPADEPLETDPPGALYVLPRDARPVTNASQHGGVLEPHTAIVVGTADGDKYREPVTVMAEPNPSGSTSWWWETDDSTGPTLTADVAPLRAQVITQRGDHQLSAIVRDDEPDHAGDVMDDVMVAADGHLFLAIGSPYAEVASFANDLTGSGRTTYVELPEGIVVETAPVAHPLDLPIVVDTVRAVTVDGRPAWHVTDDRGDEGTWHALSWMGSPHRMIAVSGTVPYDDLVEAASSLEIVTEEEWTARTGVS